MRKINYLFMFVFIFLLCSCESKKPEPIVLSTPEVVVNEDGKAVWSAVVNAVEYKYQIDNEEELTTTKLEVQLEENESIKVKALGDGKSYLDSNWSNSVKYEIKIKYNTLTFDTNGGSTVESIKVESGSVVDEPVEPVKDGYNFVCWTYDSANNNKVNWPITLTEDVTIYAAWNEVVNIKDYLSSLTNSIDYSPYSYIPDSMKPTNSHKHVESSSVSYDYSSGVNVNDVVYGGYGEQWHMVINNIIESEKFFAVITGLETVINGSVILFNNYLDSNPGNTANYELDETEYTAYINYQDKVLTYSLTYKTSFDVPLFGTINPKIDMTYNVDNGSKDVRLELTEENKIKYSFTEESYFFAVEYGADLVSRKAYFEIAKDEELTTGHIYEFIQAKDKDVVASCADFYISDSYIKVVGNKASSIVGFKGYIDEIYDTQTGNLLMYEVRETMSFLGVEGTYNTYWFNLNDISGISNLKMIKKQEITEPGVNSCDVYVNGNTKKFEPTRNSKLGVPTSRKYDIELRIQYYYGYVDGKIVEYKTEVPMMFIQADNDKDTNFKDFPSDILSKNKINASVLVSNDILDELQSDYSTLIDSFINHKDLITGEDIQKYIG